MNLDDYIQIEEPPEITENLRQLAKRVTHMRNYGHRGAIPIHDSLPDFCTSRENAEKLKAMMKKLTEKLRVVCNPHAGGAEIHTVFTIQGVQTGRAQA